MILSTHFCQIEECGETCFRDMPFSNGKTKVVSLNCILSAPIETVKEIVSFLELQDALVESKLLTRTSELGLKRRIANDGSTLSPSGVETVTNYEALFVEVPTRRLRGQMSSRIPREMNDRAHRDGPVFIGGRRAWIVLSFSSRRQAQFRIRSDLDIWPQ